jgi:uncharacterized phage protein (TIGR02220 family)
MARARNLKPSFFTNDDLCELPPLARLLFAGLWCVADRAGRLEDRPKRIKAELLPYDSCDVDKLLTSLHDSGFILRYQVAGTKLIQIIMFGKHQNPHVKEAESTIPAPDKNSACAGNSGADPADSLNPITDSLNPILPGNASLPGVTQLAQVKPNYREQAKAILEFLNAKTRQHFRVDGPQAQTNIDFVVSRLKEGVTPGEVRAVIARKVREWEGDGKMDKYLRPETLFNKTKFAQYLGEVPPPEPQHAA